MNSFPQRAVGVTLTGEEWTTILMVITRGQDTARCRSESKLAGVCGVLPTKTGC